MRTLTERVLAGGGDAGALARSVDWSKTAIGPVETWSQTLRSTASLVLNNHSGMLLWWGPEFIQIYNDAYRPVLGDKHPRAMGQPFSECWKEVFHILGPMAERPFRGGPASTSDDIALLLHRKLPREESHFRLAYSPVLDETVPGTGIGGVLATVTEITEPAYAERQLRTLRELATRSAAEASSAEEACRASALTLSNNPWDVPFALFYLFDESESVRLVAHSGSRESKPFSGSDGSAWLSAVLKPGSEIRIVPIDSSLEPPHSPWSEAPREAIVLPLRSPDHPAAYGALICGISPHRLLDAGYRSFFELAAGQIVTALRNARALEYERKRAEALAEFDRSKTLFFSNIGHEFRTPLSLISMPIEEALASPAQALQGEDLQAAHRNVKRLLKLVNQLLDFSRIEAKRAQVSYQPTDLCALTSDLASAFRSMVEHVGLRLEVDCPPLDAPVLLDPDMWEKIVLNLLANAFKFTFQGGITVSLREQTDSVELRVRDTGIGIAREQLPHLFDRFHRVEGVESRSHEGSGIGLALVADLVRLQGGQISVESELGRGTTFCVSLPRRLAHAAAAAVTAGGVHKQAFVEEAQNWLLSAPIEPEPDESAPRSQHAHILLADDNADMRAYLTRLLSSHWSVTAVSDGQAALAAARAEHPDLVLADVMMPKLDGFGLVRELRADPALATIPILLVSARAGEEAIGDGLRRGADGYITKPFSASHLLVRIEAQLNTSRMKSAAYEERRRLYTALAAAPNPILLLTGPEHVVELVNPAGLELWGKDGSVVGKPLRVASPELADQPFLPLLDEVRRSGRSIQQRATLARLDTHRNGELVDIYVDFVFEPVLDAAGRVESILVVALDVTHQVQAQRITQAALEDAQRANKTKDEFLALLGHELRNPMAPIMTALELMKFRGDRGITREREVIERQAHHLLRLVDDLLDVARIARGVVELKRSRICLQELISKALETVGPLFAEKRHRLSISVDPELQIDADAERMLQVLSNLLTNAAKYTNQGGEISVSARADAGEALVLVRDNGIGIAADMLPHVFEMFVQERQGLDRSRGGLGIGLAIVQGLVRQHGGSVRVHSEGQGQGSRFELRLPLADHELSSDVVTAHDGKGIPAAAARVRVLVVDDNEDAAELLATAIEAMGHQTEIAHDGASALQVAESFEPDVAVLDIGLPIMDGYELARRLRASSRAPRLVALTGYGQERDKQESLRAGFQAHLVKPVDIRRLALTIEDLVAG